MNNSVTVFEKIFCLDYAIWFKSATKQITVHGCNIPNASNGLICVARIAGLISLHLAFSLGS